MGFFGGGEGAGIGGSTGAIDNAILRANGTGANTLQNSDLNVDDATTTTQNNVAIANQHNGQTNSALVLTPKGTGAFIVGPKPDGISTGGNARGTNAVDLQVARAANTQVASGQYAVIGGGANNTASNNSATVGGGNNNTASGANATVGGGTDNTASNDSATVGGGYYNTASGDKSTVGGGYGNTASGDYGYATVGGGKGNTASATYATVGGGFTNTASGGNSTVGGGFSNTASGDNSTVGGGNNNTASAIYATVGGGRGLADRYGMVAHASGQFSAKGDAQAVEFVARNSTSGAATSVLFLDGSSTRFTIRNNTVLSGICTISGFSTTGAKVGLYQRSISIKNLGGTITLVHSSTISIDHEDDATWNVTITGDSATDSLNIACLGSAGDTVRWVAVFRGLEIAMS